MRRQNTKKVQGPTAENNAYEPKVHEVVQQAERLGRKLSDIQARRLSSYLQLLVRWNARMNLVGPFGWEKILGQLVADSWHLADLLQNLGCTGPLALDLGAGAGLPGIPLRVFWGHGEYLLVEPRQKRALFMERALAEMGLEATQVFCGRMEDLPPAYCSADLLVSRGFRPWKNVLEDVRALLAPKGRVVIMANGNLQDAAPPKGYSRLQSSAYHIGEQTRFLHVFILSAEGVSA